MKIINLDLMLTKIKLNKREHQQVHPQLNDGANLPHLCVPNFGHYSIPR